jgi:hypothetical protein
MVDLSQIRDGIVAKMGQMKQGGLFFGVIVSVLPAHPLSRAGIVETGSG